MPSTPLMMATKNMGWENLEISGKDKVNAERKPWFRRSIPWVNLGFQSVEMKRLVLAEDEFSMIEGVEDFKKAFCFDPMTTRVRWLVWAYSGVMIQGIALVTDDVVAWGWEDCGIRSWWLWLIVGEDSTDLAWVGEPNPPLVFLPALVKYLEGKRSMSWNSIYSSRIRRPWQWWSGKRIIIITLQERRSMSGLSRLLQSPSNH